MNISPELEKIKYIDLDKASELLQKSQHCVRQLLHRGKLKRYKLGHTTVVALDDVLTYHARKKGFPSWEENIANVRHQSFVSIEVASKELMVQPSYISRLVKNKTLEGYVTASGQIMVGRQSINAYLRKPDVSITDDL